MSITSQRKRKYRRRTTTTETPVQDEIMNMLEADEIAEEAATAEEAEVTLENGRNEVGSKQQRLLQADPCMDKHCGAGRVCKVCCRRESSRFYRESKIIALFCYIYA